MYIKPQNEDHAYYLLNGKITYTKVINENPYHMKMKTEDKYYTLGYYKTENECNKVLSGIKDAVIEHQSIYFMP